MTGCAENVGKGACNKAAGNCVWKKGYPPMEFAEDSDYQLLEAEESFFAVDGSVVDMINDMDSNMLMIAGVVFVAALLLAMRQCLKTDEKDLYEPILDLKEESVMIH